MEDSEVVFDRVLHSVGDDGKFQRRFNVIFNFLLAAAAAMTYMNLILAMVLPDHWCDVPGREGTNFTLDQWKEKTLPRENNSYGHEVYSSCSIYNVTDEILLSDNPIDEQNTIQCKYNYTYDKTWYIDTIPASQNWVCDKVLYTANILAAAKLGEVFGALLMGYLGDSIGRRSVYYLSLLLTLSSRLVTPFIVQWYIPLMVASILATLPVTTVSQTCLVILMEISPAEDRAFLAQIQNTGWTLGLSVLPLMYWFLDKWFIYMFVTTVPLTFYLVLSIFMIESPRWLLGRGRVAECLKQLKKIAKVNGTTLSPNSSLLLQNSTMEPEKVYGIGSIFSSVRLTKNAMLMILTWISCLVSYFTIVLSASSFSGNPFLNFFLQSIAEAPSYLVGRVLCDKLGRRFTGIFSFLLTIVGYIVLIMTIKDEGKQLLHISMMILSKFGTAMVYFVISLQSLEIFPTSVRQSGFSLNLTVSSLFGTLSPYIIYVGTIADARWPYVILTVFAIFGAIAEIFLPETLNEHLPETLNEARKFGMNQHYFSLPGKKRDLYILANVKFIKRNHSENAEMDDGIKK